MYLDVEEKQYEKRKLQCGDIIVEKSGGSDNQPVGRTILFEKRMAIIRLATLLRF